MFVVRKYLLPDVTPCTSCTESSDPQTSPSVVFYCHACGEVYGRVKLAGAPWTSHKGTCRLCPPYYSSSVPGSIWIAWDADYLKALPREVLLVEFEKHYHHYMKGS